MELGWSPVVPVIISQALSYMCPYKVKCFNYRDSCNKPQDPINSPDWRLSASHLYFSWSAVPERTLSGRNFVAVAYACKPALWKELKQT